MPRLVLLFFLAAFTVCEKNTAIESTTEGDCQDDPSADCEKMINFCNHTVYIGLLQKKCPISCNLCGSNCHDTSTKCEQWAFQGFCNETFYEDLINEFCPLTCGICNVSTNLY